MSASMPGALVGGWVARARIRGASIAWQAAPLRHPVLMHRTSAVTEERTSRSASAGWPPGLPSPGDAWWCFPCPSLCVPASGQQVCMCVCKKKQENKCVHVSNWALAGRAALQQYGQPERCLLAQACPCFCQLLSARMLVARCT
jgi:hypothetical protein